MTICIDNYIVIDALLKRHPFNSAAEKVLIACAATHEGCLSVNSLSDIFYVASKSIGTQAAKETIKKLIELLNIVSVNEEDCVNALALPVTDFEDALMLICAMKAQADCIVTRDKEFQSVRSVIPILSPDQLLARLK